MHFLEWKVIAFWFNFHWSIFLRVSLQLTKSPHCRQVISAVMVRVTAWCRTGDKPLPKPMLTQFTGSKWLAGCWTCSHVGSSVLDQLLWRHNERDSVSNHQPNDCLLNHSFMCKSKKTPKLRVTGLCVGNSPVTGEFPAQRASNAENVSIWWRHHAPWAIPCNIYFSASLISCMRSYQIIHVVYTWREIGQSPIISYVWIRMASG